MKYAIVITPSAKKELAALPHRDLIQIDRAILALANNPYPLRCKALQGKSKGLHRIRVGDYRVIYGVARSVLTVTVIKIGQRGDVYKGGW